MKVLGRRIKLKKICCLLDLFFLRYLKKYRENTKVLFEGNIAILTVIVKENQAFDAYKS